MPTFAYTAPNGQRRIISILLDMSDDAINNADVLALAGLAYSPEKGLHRIDETPRENPPEGNDGGEHVGPPPPCAKDPISVEQLRANRCRFREKVGLHLRSDCKCGIELGYCHKAAYEKTFGSVRDDGSWEQYKASLSLPRPSWEPKTIKEHGQAVGEYYATAERMGLAVLISKRSCYECSAGWAAGGGIRRGKSDQDGRVVFDDPARGKLRLIRRWD